MCIRDSSKLIVSQVRGEYEVRHENLVPYYNATVHMAEWFINFYIDHVPCQQNTHADTLASLAASLALPVGVVEKILVTARTCVVQESILRITRGRQEIVKSKKLLSRQLAQSLETGDSLTLIMSCTASCLRTPKKQLLLEGKLPNLSLIHI